MDWLRVVGGGVPMLKKLVERHDPWTATAWTPGSTVVGPMSGSCCPRR